MLIRIRSRFQPLWREKPALRSYGIALLAVVLAVLVRAVLITVSGTVIVSYGTFYLAILFVAWRYGLRPTILAISLSAAAILLTLFWNNGSSSVLSISTLLSMSIFVAVCALIIIVTARQRSAWQRAEERRVALERALMQVEAASHETERVNRSLETTNAYLETVLRELPPGVIIVDNSGRVLLANRQGETLIRPIERQLGAQMEPAGARVFDSDLSGDFVVDLSIVCALQRGEESRGIEVQVDHEKNPRWLRVNAVPVRDASGTVSAGIIVFEDVTEAKALRETQASLHESEARYRGLWNATFDAVLIHDQGTGIDVNEAFTHIFGFTREEIVGNPVIEMFAPPESHAVIFEHVRVGEETSYETTLRRKDGALFPAEIRGKNISLAGKTVRIASIRDLSALKQAEAHERALSEQEMQFQLLSDFIRDISHDFKTPLSVIHTSLYLLERTEVSERSSERIETIRQQTDRIAHLVDGLITMLRLNNRALTLLFKVCDLRALLQDVATLKQQSIEKKGLHFELRLTEEPLPVCADEAELGRAIGGLLDNARMFTQSGGRVTLSAYRRERQIIVEVEDTGIGISPDELGRIFNPLYRVDSARGVETGGVGLGLSIALKIAEIHDGTIDVFSVPGQGSLFRFVLPLHEEKPATA